MVEVDKFEINYKYNKYLPNNLRDSMVYISFLKGLSLATFHLFRCKINIMFDFEVKYLDYPFSINKSKQFNVELIDVRHGLALQYHYKNNHDLTTIKIKSPNGIYVYGYCYHII